MSNDNDMYKLEGLEDLLRLMKTVPEVVEKKVVKAGVRGAGARLRTYMRRAAPKGDKGLLRKSITMKYKGDNKVQVGLNSRWYYKVLDQGRAAYKRKDGTQVRGTEKFNTQGTRIRETWNSHKREIADHMILKMKEALFKEFGRMAIRGGLSRRRR
jgi:hypothetical protein